MSFWNTHDTHDFRNQILKDPDAGFKACQEFLNKHVENVWVVYFRDLGNSFLAFYSYLDKRDEKSNTELHLPWKLVRDWKPFQDRQSQEKGKYAFDLDEEKLNREAEALDQSLTRTKKHSVSNALTVCYSVEEENQTSSSPSAPSVEAEVLVETNGQDSERYKKTTVHSSPSADDKVFSTDNTQESELLTSQSLSDTDTQESEPELLTSQALSDEPSSSEEKLLTSQSITDSVSQKVTDQSVTDSDSQETTGSTDPRKKLLTSQSSSVSSTLNVSYTVAFDILTAPVHPAANLFREFKDSELDRLEESISDSGLLEPLTVYDGQLLDGRNRRATCQKLGITPDFVVLPIEQDPWNFVVDKHVRRDVSKSEQAATALDYARNNPLFQGMSDRKRIKIASDKFNVSPNYIERLVALEKKLGPQTLEEAKQGLWNIAARYRDIFGTPVAQAPPTKTISGVLEKAHKSLDKEIQSAIKTKQPIERQDLVDMQKKARELRRNLQQLKQLVK